jgi:DNA-binding CsgD family transcriptional regulator
MPTTRKKATRDWLFEMRVLFERARFTEAAKIYDEAVVEDSRVSNEAQLLRARIFLKKDSEGAAAFLHKMQLIRPNDSQCATREMYLGTAYARLRDFATSDKHFANAESFGQEAKGGEFAALVARRYMLEGDLDRAEEWCKRSRTDRSIAGRIRSTHLLSYLLGHRHKYREQAQTLAEVLDLIGTARDAFAEDWYAAVHTLAVLARELPMPEIAKRARAEVDADHEWSEDFQFSHFQALKALAWCRALEGDEIGCLRYLRQAQSVAPSDSWRVIVFLDRSYFASIMNERRWSENEFAAAEELAESIDWENERGDERIALLLLAERASVFAPARGKYFIARFNNLERLRSNLHQFAFDDRLSAMASYASGIVALRSGDAAQAEKQLRDAWSAFDRIDYDVRAGLAALALFEVSGKRRWVHLAEDKFESYPKSWLIREARRDGVSSEGPQVALTPMQDRVLRFVREGISTDGIAKQLGRSRNTVLNHMKILYKKLSVNSREALVAEALRRGLVQ